MALFNHATKELTAKIVYYGPGLCGKTSNLKILHQRLERGAGKLLSLSTAQDRTIYFDLLPIELGNIRGYTVRFQVCTVPGQVFYNETRKIVLRGVDGLVFVVDSQWSMLSHNLESFQNLKDNLHELKISFETLPVVIQYNKRDLPSALSVEALQDSLSFHSYPYVETVASEGTGVVETFKLASKLTFVDLLRRLQRGWQPPSEAPEAVLEEAPAAVLEEGPVAVPEEAHAAGPEEAPAAVLGEAPAALPEEEPAAVLEESPVFAIPGGTDESESREGLRDTEAEAWPTSVEGALPEPSDDSKGPSTAPFAEMSSGSAPQDLPQSTSLAPAVLLAALGAPLPVTPAPPAPAPPAPALLPPAPATPALGRTSSVDEKLNAVLAEARKSAGRMSGLYRRPELLEGNTQEIPPGERPEHRLEEAIAGLRAEMNDEIARLRLELADARAVASSAETAAAQVAERARRLEDILRQALHGLGG